MKVLDLFSGIGGFSLGLEWAGMETVAFCICLAKCRLVLKKHWPKVPIHDDIKTLDGTQYRGAIALVCGGFPCQPFSVAGRRKGTSDDRDLWSEMFRVIKEVRPAWVLGENVAGFVGMGFDRTATDLESEGFEVRAFVIPACAVNAPHRRDRVWIVAYANCKCRTHPIFTRNNVAERRIWTKTQWRENRKFLEMASVGGKIYCKRMDKSKGNRMDDGFQDWPYRLKQLGNSVVPQVVEIIGRAIMQANQMENEK